MRAPTTTSTLFLVTAILTSHSNVGLVAGQNLRGGSPNAPPAGEDRPEEQRRSLPLSSEQRHPTRQRNLQIIATNDEDDDEQHDLKFIAGDDEPRISRRNLNLMGEQFHSETRKKHQLSSEKTDNYKKDRRELDEDETLPGGRSLSHCKHGCDRDNARDFSAEYSHADYRDRELASETETEADNDISLNDIGLVDENDGNGRDLQEFLALEDMRRNLLLTSEQRNPVRQRKLQTFEKDKGLDSRNLQLIESYPDTEDRRDLHDVSTTITETTDRRDLQVGVGAAEPNTTNGRRRALTCGGVDVRGRRRRRRKLVSFVDENDGGRIKHRAVIVCPVPPLLQRRRNLQLAYTNDGSSPLC